MAYSPLLRWGVFLVPFPIQGSPSQTPQTPWTVRTPILRAGYGRLSQSCLETRFVQGSQHLTFWSGNKLEGGKGRGLVAGKGRKREEEEKGRSWDRVNTLLPFRPPVCGKPLGSPRPWLPQRSQTGTERPRRFSLEVFQSCVCVEKERRAESKACG